MVDYSDTSKYKVHGGVAKTGWNPPEGYPEKIHNDPLISNYALALNPQWNTVLNPQVNLGREGVGVINWIKSKGNDADVRNLAAKYFKTNPMPYSNPVDPTIDYSMAVQRAQETARSYGVPFVYPEDPVIKAARIRLEDIERARLTGENNLRLKEIKMLQEIQNQEITFNEQQNSGDYNETPITEINPMDSCAGCGVDHALNREQQEKEKIMKIGGIAAVGVGILLLYTRRNKK
jgi:hypothetical protein